MKKILLLLMAIVAMAASAATKYEINVAGVEVTSDNANYITGGDITGGYGVYNASTNTLTLYNMTIYRTGQDNYGIHNRKCDNLKIVFSGNCSIRTADNALKLERATTLNAASGSDVWFYSSARICANLKSYNYYITGSGTMLFEAGPSAYEAIKGDGTSSTNVYFQGAEVLVSSSQRSALSSFAAYLQSGTDLTIEGNGSNVSVSGVSMTFSGNTTILEPYGAYYSSNSVYNSSGSQITSGNIYISDNYALLINSSNFPNSNFRSALLALYPKGYLTTSQLQNFTSLNVSDKYISSLTGVEKLTYLKTLNCSNNQITSLPTLPSSLTTLDCHSNQITSYTNFPTSLQSINCASNKFSGTLTLIGRSNLKTLDVSGNPSLTTLNCYSNALTSLNVSGCSAMTTLDCNNNQLTSLETLPSSLQSLNCTSNKFSGTFSLTGRSNLKALYIGNNTSLTTLNCYSNSLTTLSVSSCSALTSLYCYSNALTTLDVSSCSALTTVNCSSNQLTSLYLPASTSLQSVNCSSNKFSGTFTLTGRSNLKTLNISNNPSLTTLNCNNNALTSLTTDGCSSLTTLDCSNNQLTSPGAIHASMQNINCSNNRLSGTSSLTDHSNLKTLNISSNPSLTALYCQNNSLTSLNVQNCSAMTTLQCHNNQLTSLNLTGCSALTSLSCNNNQLTSLTNLPMSLQSLYCGSNKFSGTFSLTSRSNLKTLDVSSNSYITTLNCFNNVLTSLNVSGCSAMTTLDCHSNQLTSLGTLPTSLQSLNCASNNFSGTFTVAGYSNLKSLNVSNNSSITTLNCYTNALTSLIYSGCTAMKTLDCANNKLGALASVPNSLTKINCSANLLTSLPSMPVGLQELECAFNQLTSLSVNGLNSLTRLVIYNNQIKENAMGTLVNSMRTIPAGSTGTFLVHGGSEEGNVITGDQVNTARNKRWYPKKMVNGEWVDIPGAVVVVPGDVDGDGHVGSADITALYNWLLNNDNSALVNGDQNGDGKITSVDVTAVYNILLGN